MKRIVKSILAATLLAAAASSASAQENYRPSPEIVAAQEQARDCGGAGAVPGEPVRNIHSLGHLLHVRPGRVGSELQRIDPRGIQQDGRGLLSRRFRRSRVGERHQSLRSQVHLHHYPSPRRLLDVRQQVY